MLADVEGDNLMLTRLTPVATLVKNNSTAYHAFGKYWMQARGFLNYRLKYCWPKVIYCSACQAGVSYTPGCTKIFQGCNTVMGCTGVYQVCALEEQSHLSYNVLSSISVCQLCTVFKTISIGVWIHECPSFFDSLFVILVRWPSRDHVSFYVQCSSGSSAGREGRETLL